MRRVYSKEEQWGFVATVVLALSRCSWDPLHKGLFYTGRRRATLRFLQPFNWKNVVPVNTYGHGLFVNSGSWLLVCALAQDA